jgi:hypothetical protein
MSAGESNFSRMTVVICDALLFIEVQEFSMYLLIIVLSYEMSMS